MSAKKKAAPKAETTPPQQNDKVSFFPAWCKGCGTCVAFCPRKALGMDQWGHPHLAQPDRCTSCGLCEMLCPDFAISVGGAADMPGARPACQGDAASQLSRQASPERLAAYGEEDGDA